MFPTACEALCCGLLMRVGTEQHGGVGSNRHAARRHCARAAFCIGFGGRLKQVPAATRSCRAEAPTGWYMNQEPGQTRLLALAAPNSKALVHTTHCLIAAAAGKFMFIHDYLSC